MSEHTAENDAQTLARVEALCAEWEEAAKKPRPARAEGETAQDDGVRIGVWHAVKTAAVELRAALTGDESALPPRVAPWLRRRAALADPAGALATHDAEVEERVLRAFADHDLHGLIPHSEIGNRWYHDGLRGAQDAAREWADYRADHIEAQS